MGTIPFHLIMFVVLALVIFFLAGAGIMAAHSRVAVNPTAEDSMHRSAERIPTTHTGSLLRPMELTRGLLALCARGQLKLTRPKSPAPGARP